MKNKELFDQEHTITLVGTGGSGRELKPGDIVGGTYRLKTLIGRGGMGYVFCAAHTMIGRDYALKAMAPEHMSEINWKRFEFEGRAIAALDHPNIVKVYNMGVDSGDSPYIVMDLLVGNPLSQLVRSGRRMEIDQLLDIFIQTARGLEYAHSKGIVHRDVKPSNIMLVQDGAGRPLVRIVDFGLAKLVRDELGRDQRITATGTVSGSPYYMSPEQCMGESVDARSDIYSLGCSLYESVMGEPPFVGNNPMETVMMHSNKPVPRLSGVFEDEQIARRMNLLVGRMMAKRKDERYQTMAQVIQDIERVRENKDIGRGYSTAAPGELAPVGSPALAKTGTGGQSQARGRYESNVVSVGHSRKNVIDFDVKKTMIAGAAFVAVASGGLLVWALSPSLAPAKNKRQEVIAVSGRDKELEKIVIKNIDLDPINLPTNFGDSDGEGKFGRSLMEHASGFKQAKAILKDFGPIRATTSGRITSIHFPSYPIGRVRLNLNDQEREAINNVEVPASAPLTLCINWCNDPVMIDNSFIYEGIDKNLFQGIDFKAQAVAVSGDKIKDIQVPGLIQLLTAARKWPKMAYLKIVDLRAMCGDSKVLESLQALPHLQELTVDGCELDLKQLSQYSFVTRLRHIELPLSRANADDLLSALSDSQELDLLSLDIETATAPAIARLSSCPRLKNVIFRAKPFPRDKLEAICRLPHLESMVLLGLRPTNRDLSLLSHVNRNCKVFLAGKGFNETEKTAWLKVFPALNFSNRESR